MENNCVIIVMLLCIATFFAILQYNSLSLSFSDYRNEVDQNNLILVSKVNSVIKDYQYAIRDYNVALNNCAAENEQYVSYIKQLNEAK